MENNNDEHAMNKNNKQSFGFENERRAKLLEDCSIADSTELDNMIVNETIAQKNMKSKIDVFENDDQLEIVVLNNHKLEIKKINI